MKKQLKKLSIPKMIDDFYKGLHSVYGITVSEICGEYLNSDKKQSLAFEPAVYSLGRFLYNLGVVQNSVKENASVDDSAQADINQVIYAYLDAMEAMNEFVVHWSNVNPENEIQERNKAIADSLKKSNFLKNFNSDFSLLQSLTNQLAGAKGSDTIDTHVNEEDVIPNFSGVVNRYITNHYNPSADHRSNADRVVHHEKGKASKNMEIPTLELNFAGSSNAQIAKMYKGFTGKEDYVSIAENAKLNRQKGVRPVNRKFKINWEGYQRGSQRVREAHDIEYGHFMYMDKQGHLTEKPSLGTMPCPGVRKKVDGSRTRYNLSGPLGGPSVKPGMLNAGKYSIGNLTNYALQLADDFLTPILANYIYAQVDHREVKPVNIFMKGHSRGAVACNETSAALNYLLNTKFSQIKHLVHINMQLLDPVPGPDGGLLYGAFDHASGNTVRGSRNVRGLAATRDEAIRNDSSVFYSLHSNHPAGFAPQMIQNTSRVFLSCINHTMNIVDIDDGHKRGFFDAETGEEYRGTGFEDHKKGLFFIDEFKNIVEVKNPTEAHRVISGAIKKLSIFKRFTQSERHEEMHELVEQWFATHPKEITENDVRHEGVKEVRESYEALGKLIEAENNPNEDLRPANFKGAASRILATILKNESFFKKVESTSHYWNEKNTKKLSEEYKKMSDGSLVSNIESKGVFKQFIKNATMEELKSIYEARNTERGEVVIEKLHEVRERISVAEMQSGMRLSGADISSNQERKTVPNPVLPGFN